MIIPPQFFIYNFLGTILILGMGLSFFIVGIIAINNAMKQNGTILLSDFTPIILSNMAMLAMFIAHPLPDTIHFENNYDDQSSSPLYNDLSHLSSNVSVLQDCLSWSIVYYKLVNDKAERDSGQSGPTGDSAIDQIDSPRMMNSYQKLIEILMKSSTCYIHDDNEEQANQMKSNEDSIYDCSQVASISDRLYGQDGSFAGIFGLTEEFLVAAIQLSQNPMGPPESNTELHSSQQTNYISTEKITLNHLSVRYMNDAIQNDLRIGLNLFHDVLNEINKKDLKYHSSILIVEFLFTHICLFVGIFVFIIPSRHSLIKVHQDTVKMNEISPDSANVGGIWDENGGHKKLSGGQGGDDDFGFDDDSEDIINLNDENGNDKNKSKKKNIFKDKMKSINEWKAEYACGMDRLDAEHQLLLKAAKKLVKHTVDLMNALEKEDNSDKQNKFDSYRNRSEQGEGDINNAITPYSHHTKNPSQNIKYYKIAKLKQAYIALKNFVLVIFSTFADEEKLMLQAKIVKMHRQEHGFKHSTLLRELIPIIVTMATKLGWIEDDVILQNQENDEAREYERIDSLDDVFQMNDTELKRKKSVSGQISIFEIANQLFLKNKEIGKNYNIDNPQSEIRISLKLKTIKIKSVFKCTQAITTKINMWSADHLSGADRDIGLVLSSQIQPRLQIRKYAPALRDSESV
ncbi:MAG: hypothetical protein EZS28_034664, partial [Streblomastix strix]